MAVAAGKGNYMKKTEGKPLPLGVSGEGEKINFSVAVPEGKSCSLLLYRAGEEKPCLEYPMEEVFGEVRYLALESASTVEKLFPDWNGRCLRLNDWIMRQAVETKQKDYENTFRWITYDSAAERSAVLGERITGVSFTLPQYQPVPWI